MTGRLSIAAKLPTAVVGAVAAAIEARLRSCGRFRAYGIQFVHPGVLVDQRACVEAVAKLLAGVPSEIVTQNIRSRLRRVTVRVEVAPRLNGVPVSMRAVWRGGWRDRGLVVLRDGSDVPRRVAEGLRALLVADGVKLTEGRK